MASENLPQEGNSAGDVMGAVLGVPSAGLPEHPPGADPVAVNTPSETKTTGGRPAWIGQLPKNLQDNDKLTNFKNIGDLGKSYLDLVGVLGKSVSIPDDKADANEWQQFFSRIGRPDKPEGYEIKPPDIPSADKTVLNNFATNLSQQMHKLGLSKKQATEFYKWYVDQTKSVVQSQTSAVQKVADTSRKTLETEWGADYTGNIERVSRMMDRHDPQNTFRKQAEQNGFSYSVPFMKFLLSLAEQAGEDRFVKGNNYQPGSDGFDYPSMK
jgi:hypothetical protein